MRPLFQSSPFRLPESELDRILDGYQAAFVLQDLATGQSLRYHPERCARRVTPCSTFKIPNSLIFLEAGLAKDEKHRLRWDGVTRPIPAWNRDHTLETAIRDSVVWYYQQMAAKVGEARMREYLRRLNYGNQDISGGLTRFWLESTLKISPNEQVAFLQRLCQNTLPFSRRSQEIVRRLLIQDRSGNTVLRGKTGTGGDLKKNVATLGWYVGYLTYGRQVALFATQIEGGENPSGRQARALTRQLFTAMGRMV